MSDIEIQEFDRVVDCGREVDFNASLSESIVRVRTGLTPTQYVKIGMSIGKAVSESARIPGIAPMVGAVD